MATYPLNTYRLRKSAFSNFSMSNFSTGTPYNGINKAPKVELPKSGTPPNPPPLAPSPVQSPNQPTQTTNVGNASVQSTQQQNNNDYSQYLQPIVEMLKNPQTLASVGSMFPKVTNSILEFLGPEGFLHAYGALTGQGIFGNVKSGADQGTELWKQLLYSKPDTNQLSSITQPSSPIQSPSQPSLIRQIGPQLLADQAAWSGGKYLANRASSQVSQAVQNQLASRFGKTIGQGVLGRAMNVSGGPYAVPINAWMEALNLTNAPMPWTSGYESYPEAFADFNHQTNPRNAVNIGGKNMPGIVKYPLSSLSAFGNPIRMADTYTGVSNLAHHLTNGNVGTDPGDTTTSSLPALISHLISTHNPISNQSKWQMVGESLFR